MNWQRGFHLNNVFVPHRKHTMTQTDLSDVHSVTPLEASEAAAGLCEMTADRQTDRHVLISLAACLASSRCAALPCWRVVISETDRASLE
jgi:hypothetical protein